MSYTLLVFAAYTLFAAIQNGIVAWLFREYVPPGRLDWINAALHTGGIVIYAVVVVGAAGLAPQAWLAAWLTRWLLFDVVLNGTTTYFNHREHRPAESLFRVGASAASDRATRWVAARLGAGPERVRFISWLLALGSSLLLLNFSFFSHLFSV